MCSAMAGKKFSEILLRADAVVTEAETALILALKKYRPETTLEFTDQAFSLPICSSLTGLHISKLADLKLVVEAIRSLMPCLREEKEDCQNSKVLLDAGVAALYAEEILATLAFLGYTDYWSISAGAVIPDKWCYAADNTVLRRHGVGLIDKSVPGIAVVIATQAQNAESQKLVRELRDKNLYVFETDGASASGMIFPLGFACRIARLFGGVKPGDKDALFNYCKEKIPGFIVALGPLDDLGCLNVAGASSWQLPLLSTEDIHTICPAAFSSFSAGAIKGNSAVGKIVEAAFDLRSMQLPLATLDIPASLGSAFAGERIRDDLLYTESGGGRTDGIELLVSRDLKEVEDGDVTLFGPDITDIHPGQNLPLAFLVEVAGRLLQSDYEPVLERQLHSAINSIEGVMHEGQRDLMWLRISRHAARKGLSLLHIGKVIYAKLRQDFSRIIDKVQVKIFTQQESVGEVLAHANRTNIERDRRLQGMTDDDTDIFYSCIICQSFAPHHVCVITPQRAGMCGALSWLDGKASSEININGPNRPIRKGKILDPLRGEFAGVNAFVRQASHGVIKRLGCYSLMRNPMTAGNCFEAVAVILPLCNGIMVVNREYRGMTPSGMDFTMLADLVGGGDQTPGLVGINRYYPLSPKFFPAEGGLSRLVWVPKKLKEELREGIIGWCQAMGLPVFFDMIADETKGIAEEDVLAFLRERGHPALKLDPIV